MLYEGFSTIVDQVYFEEKKWVSLFKKCIKSVLCTPKDNQVCFTHVIILWRYL